MHVMYIRSHIRRITLVISQEKQNIFHRAQELVPIKNVRANSVVQPLVEVAIAVVTSNTVMMSMVIVCGFPKQSDDPYFFMDDDDFEAANATRPRETRFACPAGKRVVKGQRCDRTQNNFEVIGIDISARVYSYDEYDCTEQQCCQTATTCDGFTCGVFSTLKSGAENIACEGESCTAEECCNPNPVCPSAPEFSCPVGKQSINNQKMFSVLLQHAQRAIAVYMHTVIQDKKD